MGSIDRRMMVVVTCAVVVGISAVVIAKKRDSAPEHYSVREIVMPDVAPRAEPLESGLEISVSKAGLTMIVPDCNIERYKENFFLHVFPEPFNKSSKYANLDFNLAGEKGLKVTVDEKNACIYSKSFKDVIVSEVTVGQFFAPGGACCKILWSRNYVFDRDPAISK